MKKKLRLSLNLALTVFFIIAILINSPNLNPLYADGAFSLCFIITAYIVVNFIIGLGGVKFYQDENGMTRIDYNKGIKGVKGAIGTLIIIWGAYFIVNIASSPIINYKAYRDQLGEPVVSEFTSDVQPLDINELPIVDRLLAAELADKKLGENPGMGSQVNLGEPVIQEVDGKLVWAVPLEHSGFFKWLKNLEGSAGYIVVSATNVKDVVFVGDHKIKYQTNAFLFDDIERHLRFMGGGLFKGITDFSFELNDSGVPYWIATTYKNKWLFALPEATGVITVNASTGATDEYSINEVPDWVDRVQPEEFIMKQISNKGNYIHGIFNFSNQDKFKTSEGQIIVYNEGNCYLFTGLTSVGADQSAIGFIMVDMVTKESKTYKISGATENAARISAQGKVQQFGYSASFPLIINLDGNPTYFMTLKDKAGLIKQYAFVSVIDYTSVGTGETISDAIRNFRQVLRGSSADIVAGGNEDTITDTVLRIEQEIVSGSTVYKIILTSNPNYIFVANYDISEELALTQVGDTVSIEYTKLKSGIMPCSSFDNKNFSQQIKE